jgi:Tfp pilus assembly protein PilN
MDKKTKDIEELKSDTNNKISVIQNNKMIVDARAREYETLLARIKEANDEWTESMSRRNAIPNLLSRIMYAIPKEVQITSIRNTVGKTVQIEAQSERYQFLGFFIAKLKNDALLINIMSTEGTRVDGVIRITITGELPY